MNLMMSSSITRDFIPINKSIWSYYENVFYGAGNGIRDAGILDGTGIGLDFDGIAKCVITKLM